MIISAFRKRSHAFVAPLIFTALLRQIRRALRVKDAAGDKALVDVGAHSACLLLCPSSKRRVALPARHLMMGIFGGDSPARVPRSAAHQRSAIGRRPHL